MHFGCHMSDTTKFRVYTQGLLDYATSIEWVKKALQGVSKEIEKFKCIYNKFHDTFNLLWGGN